nr:SGNH/GDSL hydrolase family protein [Clostridiales bacterium]
AEETPAESRPVILMLGDSYAAGQGGFTAGFTEGGGSYWPDYLAGMLPQYRCYTYACGGIGFIHEASGRTIPSLLPYALRRCGADGLTNPEDVKWVIAAAGYNDKDEATYDELRETVSQFVNDAQAAFPNATVVIGQIGWKKSGTAASDAVRDILLKIVAAAYRDGANSAGALYIGNIEYLFTDHDEWIGSDYVHPTEEGCRMIAEYIAVFLQNTEEQAVTIEYYYPDGSLYEQQNYDGGIPEDAVLPEIDLGGGVKITGWNRDGRGLTAEYESGLLPADQEELSSPYTRLYGVLNTDSDYTGFRKVGEEWWYFLHGVVRKNAATIVNAPVNGVKDWWYVNSSGKLDLKYNGFAKNKNGWWYVVNGRVNFKKTDIVNGTINGKTAWYNTVHNKLTPGPTVAHNKNGWWYIDKNGKVDFSYNGFAKNKNGWWYAVKGKVDFTKTDVVKGTINGKTAWYNIVRNKLTAGPTIAHNKNGWWYIDKTGKVDFSYTGFAKNKNGWWYAVKGKVDFTKSGYVKGTIDGKTAWYHIVNNKLKTTR